MAKPTDKQEAYWRSETRWKQGRVSKRFKKKYGRCVPPHSMHFFKRQLSRSRRRAGKNLLAQAVEEADEERFLEWYDEYICNDRISLGDDDEATDLERKLLDH